MKHLKTTLAAAGLLLVAACNPEDIKQAANDALEGAGEVRQAALAETAKAADAYCAYLPVRRAALHRDLNALTKSATVTIACAGGQ